MRSSRRQLRVSVRFNDHVMVKLSQRRNDLELEDIRVEENVLIEEIGGKEGDKTSDMADTFEEIGGKEGDKTSDMVDRMEIKETTKNLVWAKLNNIPLEAISNKGISALASSLGKPLRMDNTTAKVCQSGMGKGEYTRVLVEFDVNKGFKDEICIRYRNKENQVKGTKSVKVEYQWRSEICTHYKVFGHDVSKCKNVVRVDDGKNKQGETNNEKRKHYCEEEGFIEEKPWKAWTSLNKFAVFEKNDMDEQQELNQLKDMMIVDQYLNKKLQLSCSKTNNWSKDMIYYFKTKWEEDRAKEKEGNDESNEDVNDGRNDAVNMCSANVVSGMGTTVLD
ncbi:RNA-directed DNA polymerase, eukaryota, reverse transcriptase zinc-binding domain protein [Tanacetum coccineum]